MDFLGVFQTNRPRAVLFGYFFLNINQIATKANLLDDKIEIIHRENTWNRIS